MFCLGSYYMNTCCAVRSFVLEMGVAVGAGLSLCTKILSGLVNLLIVGAVLGQEILFVMIFVFSSVVLLLKGVCGKTVC